MFAVIYRSRVCHGKEEEFQYLWSKIANYFIEHRGALGSSLHRTEDGEWIAYSRWPDKAIRDASWPREGEIFSETLSSEIKSVIVAFKNCIDKNQPLQEICMEVMNDLLMAKTDACI